MLSMTVNQPPSRDMKSPLKVRNVPNLRYNDKASTIAFSDSTENIYLSHGFVPCGDSFRVNLAPTSEDVTYYCSLPEEVRQLTRK